MNIRQYTFGDKIVLGSAISAVVTLIFALYNGILGIYHFSLWNGSICAYYILLTSVRGIAVIAERKSSGYPKPEKSRLCRKAYLQASVLLLVANLSMIAPVSLMVMLEKPLKMGLIPAIAAAAYTTYRVTFASVNYKRRLNSGELMRLLRTINLIDALFPSSPFKTRC